MMKSKLLKRAEFLSLKEIRSDGKMGTYGRVRPKRRLFLDIIEIRRKISRESGRQKLRDEEINHEMNCTDQRRE